MYKEKILGIDASFSGHGKTDILVLPYSHVHDRDA